MKQELFKLAKEQYPSISKFKMLDTSFKKYRVGYSYDLTNKLNIICVIHVTTFSNSKPIFFKSKMQYKFFTNKHLLEKVIDHIQEKLVDTNKIDEILNNLFDSFNENDYKNIKNEHYGNE